MHKKTLAIAFGSALSLLACSQSETSGQADTSADPVNTNEQGLPAITERQTDTGAQPMTSGIQTTEQTDQAAFEASATVDEPPAQMDANVDNMRGETSGESK
jgi:hypothetical protein